MQLTSIEGGGGEIIQSEDGAALIAEYLTEYEGGAIGALYSLGVAFSAGSRLNRAPVPRWMLSIRPLKGTSG